MENSVKAKFDEKLSLKYKLAYGMGSLGNNLIYGLITTYIMIYYTDYFGLAAASVGTLFLVARIWDAVNDPIMGMIVDNTHTRWGKFRPYLLVVPLIMGTATVLCFSAPNLSPTGKLIFAYVTYIAWGMSFTAMDIPYWSMTATLTQDPEERNSVVMIPRTLANVAGIFVAVFTLPLVSFLGGDDPLRGWQLTAVLFSVACVLLTWITFFTVKEKVEVEKKGRQTYKDVINLVRENDQLRSLIGSMLVAEFVNAIKMILVFYYITYNYNAVEYIPIFMGLYAVVNIGGSILSPTISRKIGKQKTAFIGILVTAVSYVIMFFFGYNAIASLLFFSGVGGFTWGFTWIALMSMLTDTVEYGEWKTGKRSEGTVFSLNIFKTKLAGAFGGAVGAYTLGFIGYQPDVVQSLYTLDWIHMLYTIIPGIVMFAALYPLSKYDLSEDKYRNILMELRGATNEE